MKGGKYRKTYTSKLCNFNYNKQLFVLILIAIFKTFAFEIVCNIANELNKCDVD